MTQARACRTFSVKMLCIHMMREKAVLQRFIESRKFNTFMELDAFVVALTAR